MAYVTKAILERTGLVVMRYTDGTRDDAYDRFKEFASIWKEYGYTPVLITVFEMGNDVPIYTIRMEV